MTHSSRVSLCLLIGSQSYSVSQVGPDSLILSKPAEIAPGEARIVIVVDGTEREYAVRVTGVEGREVLFHPATK